MQSNVGIEFQSTARHSFQLNVFSYHLKMLSGLADRNARN